MTLYWIRDITSNRPTVLTYIGHHTSVNNAAREVFNGRHKDYYSGQTKKFDAKKDVLLYSETRITLSPFNQDELQEESED